MTNYQRRGKLIKINKISREEENRKYKESVMEGNVLEWKVNSIF